MYSIDQVSDRVEEILRATLKLADDVVLEAESDLVSEIGLDSIEAFELVAALHEMLGVRIPEDLEPKSMRTIHSIASYIVDKYSASQVQEFMALDIASELARMQDGGELV